MADNQAQSDQPLATHNSAQSAPTGPDEQWRKLHRAVEQSVNGVVITDLTGAIEYVNPAFTRLTGYTLDEVVGKNSRILKSGETSPEEYARLWQTITGGGEWRGVFHNRRKNGELYWERALISPIRDAQGVITHFVAIKEDISEQRRIEDALRSGDARLRAIVDSLNDAVFELDAEARFVSIYGRRSEEGGKSLTPLVGKTVRESFGDDIGAACEAAVARALGGASATFLLKLDTTHTHYFHVTLSPVVHGAHEEPRTVVGVARDVTALKQAEQSEHEARVLAEALRDTAEAMATQLDPDLLLGYILEIVGRVVAHDAANLMLIEGEQIRVAAHRGYPEAFAEFFKTFRLSPDLANFTHMITTHKPSLVSDTTREPTWLVLPETDWVRSYVGAPITLRGNVIGFVCLDSATPGFFKPHHAEWLLAFCNQAALALENARLYDQLRREKAELERRVEQRTMELFRAKEHVEAILNNSSDAIIVTREGGLISQANPAFKELFGCSGEDVFHMPLNTLAQPADAPSVDAALHTVLATRQPARIEIVAQRLAGGTFVADVVLSPIFGGSGAGIVCSIRDITQRRQLEVDLREALDRERELSELKSRFISTVSHEFRTPLTVISTSASLIYQYGDRLTDEQKAQHFEKIQSEVRELAALLEDVLVISRGEAGRLKAELAPLDLARHVQDVVRDLELTTNKSRRFNYTQVGPCPPILADERLLRQIMLNLLSNAVKYSGEGSPIDLKLQCLDDRITLEIRDHGMGIPEADRPHVFEIFHRGENAAQIEGTGLGLAIVRQAVALQGWDLSFESELGLGTAFTLTIPLSTATRV